MNYFMVKRLMWKDWYLQRWLIVGALATGALGLGIICTGGKAAFLLGLILVIMVIVGFGAQVSMSTTINERKEQTLAFVMSLPISYREYTAAKILGNVLLFLVPWTVLVFGSFVLIGLTPASHGLVPYVAIMSIEMLVSTCLVVVVALVSESQGWAIAAIMVGNIALNMVGYLVAHVGSIARTMFGSSIVWSPAAVALLLGEIVLIAALLSLTLYFQSRKKDFL